MKQQIQQTGMGQQTTERTKIITTQAQFSSPTVATTDLRRLSNQDLELQLKNLIQKERKLLHVILEHIKEVDRRQMYLGKAYSSLYEYLIKEMGYSGSAAMRRLEAARLLREVPAMAAQIQSGQVNLSQIGELSRAIKEKQKDAPVSAQQKEELIQQISGKTLQDTQQTIAKVLDLSLQKRDRSQVQKDESVRMEITLSKEQFSKLKSCRDQAVHQLTQNHQTLGWGEVLGLLADLYLKKTSPHSKKSTTASVLACDTKRVTAKTKRLVYDQDQCCQFVDVQTGRKCQSTFALQVDHIQPRWAGGGNRAGNLQILCAAHNAYKYRQQAGIRRL